MFSLTNSCIFLISCKVCSQQYIGETGELRRRSNNHRSTIKTVWEHFNMSGHKWEDMPVMGIDHNPHWSDAEMKSKRKFWRHRLKYFRPDIMNKQIYFIKIYFHCQTSPDTHKVVLTNLSTVPLSVITFGFLSYLLFVKICKIINIIFS